MLDLPRSFRQDEKRAGMRPSHCRAPGWGCAPPVRPNIAWLRMRPNRFPSILPVVTLALIAAPAAAQWAPGGVRLCQGGCSGYALQIIGDAAGGAFVAWVELSQTNGSDVYLQHVTPWGVIAPGWPPGGLPVTFLSGSQGLTDLAPDGLGGALIVWFDHRNVELGSSKDVYAQRILADGSIAPGWPVNGAPVTRGPGTQDFSLIAPDGAGGAYVAWDDERDYSTRNTDIYAQHLTANGTVAAGWPENGLSVCIDPAGQFPWGLVPDDSGGVVVVWGDSRGGIFTTYAQRLHVDGTIAPGWVENGVLVVNQVARGGAVADGAGGFYAGAASLEPIYYDDSEYYVQRFTFEGTRAPGWPEGGLRVCGAPRARYELKVVEDAAGGALLAWDDERSAAGGSDNYVARVLPEGVLAPGWTADGVLVSSPAAFDHAPDIAPDGAGGGYVVWRQESGGSPSFVQHLTSRGAVAPGWPAYGVQLAQSSGQFDSQIASDGRGGAIVGWDEQQSRRGIWAQRFVIDGVVAVQVALVRAVAEPDRVALVWHVAEALSFRATVERRSQGSDWRALGDVNADGTGRIDYEDRAVAASERYAYRLAYLEDGAERYTAETWVEVPSALPLALEGFRPNPAVREITASFTLASAAPATFELLDLAGRRVIEREVGSLGAGRHQLRLGDGPRLAPGIYWLRLTQSGHALMARGVLVR